VGRPKVRWTEQRQF